MNRDTRDDSIIRDLLVRIDESADVNQRALSKELNIALGMTNAYVKRCVKKGFIKVSEIPARRYRYYLTPKGFTEKSRLTAQYFSDSLAFFRRARKSFDRLFAELEASGRARVVLCGLGDLGEIAMLSSVARDIELMGFWRPARAEGDLKGLEEIQLHDRPEIDFWVLVSSDDMQGDYRELVCHVPAAHIVAPDLLQFAPEPQGPVTDAPDQPSGKTE